MLSFPQINPSIVEIGPFNIKWYGVAYAVGIIIGSFLISKLSYHLYTKKFYKFYLNKTQLDKLIVYTILGIVLGGRLGYVLFYDPQLFVKNFIQVFNTLQGGMSFHGGLIGLLIAIKLYSIKYKISFLYIVDLIAVAAPIGILLGRLANFINCELVGRYTDVPWGMMFPNDYYPRHPSQIYEALTEGLLLLIIMNYLAFYTSILKRSGISSGMFAILYAIMRIVCELFREPDQGYLGIFTYGQILTFPMILIGILLIKYHSLKPTYNSIIK
jgi:phosphatidylglycerol:prolipoprotein diacylglycerol transferase